MIRKLRLKFVAACMLLVTAVLAVVFFSVYTALQRNMTDLSRQFLRQAIQADSGMRDFRRPELAIDINGDRLLLPYFTVELLGNSAYVTGGTYEDLNDSETLTAILEECLASREDEGVLPRYHLRYLRQNRGLMTSLAFVDMSMEQAVIRQMMMSYLSIAALALALLLAVSVLLSRWVTRPVERAWKQQRQFLSDASHELKTPLTVILSNAEMLESAPLEERTARWVDNIHSEARQMRALVEEMLTLARADNMVHTAVMGEVNLSDLMTECVLAFEPVAFEARKPLGYQIQEGLHVIGDRDQLRQLTAILLDNAIKYGAEGGTITLTLTATDRQAKVTVSNPGTPIPAQQLPRLFERFYRADASRGEQSGFGLGLPIAASIAQEHKASLKAESDADSTRFLFTMNLKK